jgi:hypothetical protein
MEIERFLSFKNDPQTLEINKQLSAFISIISGGKKHNNSQNKNNNILKNPKMQSLKDKTENKVNLVLNKLSELNFNVLLTEFCETIGKVNENEFLELQKAFYIKIISDINFIKIYLSFFKVIAHIYSISCKYNIKYFLDIVEMKFVSDYKNEQLSNDFKFLADFDEETKRINNLVLIKYLLQMNFLNNNIKNEINNIILSQNNYYADIYYWFQNEELSNEYKQIIKNKTLNNTLPLREKVLLDNLLEDKKHQQKQETTKIDLDSNNKMDTLDIETDNILEEYLFVESVNEVISFINTSCKDAISKNKFSQYCFEKFFTTQSEYTYKILDLLKQLVKKQILFKSNLSRGIILINNNWDDKSIDYINPKMRMKEALVYLKTMGITNNLENILTKYQIDYY